MRSLFFIEVIYNKQGTLFDPNSEVVKRFDYHSLFVPVWAESLEEADRKTRDWFSISKPEYKVIQLINNKAIE